MSRLRVEFESIDFNRRFIATVPKGHDPIALRELFSPGFLDWTTSIDREVSFGASDRQLYFLWKLRELHPRRARARPRQRRRPLPPRPLRARGGRRRDLPDGPLVRGHGAVPGVGAEVGVGSRRGRADRRAWVWLGGEVAGRIQPGPKVWTQRHRELHNRVPCSGVGNVQFVTADDRPATFPSPPNLSPPASRLRREPNARPTPTRPRSPDRPAAGPRSSRGRRGPSG